MMNTAPQEWPDPQIIDSSPATCKEVIIRDNDIDLETQAPKVMRLKRAAISSPPIHRSRLSIPRAHSPAR